MVVLPHPGGPRKSIEGTLPDYKKILSGLPGQTRCVCHIKSSKLCGLTYDERGSNVITKILNKFLCNVLRIYSQEKYGCNIRLITGEALIYERSSNYSFFYIYSAGISSFCFSPSSSN